MTQRYAVPEEGLKAATKAAHPDINQRQIKVILEAFIRWQSEHPTKPTVEQTNAIYEYLPGCGPDTFAEQWIRQMYLAPEPEIEPSRVFIQQIIGDGPEGEERWYVFCDGVLKMDFPNNEKEIAEVYADGLRYRTLQGNNAPAASELSVPEEIKDLFLKEKEDDSDWDTCCRANKAISEAFRRGKESNGH